MSEVFQKIMRMGIGLLLSIILFSIVAPLGLKNPTKSEVMYEINRSDDPYISEPDYSTYDAGNDGKDDSVEVSFGVESNSSAYVYYTVSLYSNNDNLINSTTSDIFTVDSNTFWNCFEDLGSVSAEGYYYVTIELYNTTESGSTATLVDFWQSDSFYLYAKDSATVPSPPQNLQATAGDGQVTLTWNPPTNDGGSTITEYKIYRGTSSGGESYYDYVVGGTTTYTDNSVTNGQTYYYYVTAVNSVGESDKSNEVSVTPQAGVTVPSPPQNLYATAGDGYVDLFWDEPANNGGSEITEYKIYRGTASGKEIYLTSVSGYLTYTDFSVINGQTYYYYVTAVNSAGESNPSNEVSVTPRSSSGNLKITIELPNSKKISETITVNGEKYNVPYEIIAGEKAKIIVKVTNGNNPAGRIEISMYTMGIYDPSTNTSTLSSAGSFNPQKGKTNSQGIFTTYYYAPHYNKVMYVFVVGVALNNYSQTIVLKIIPKSSVGGSVSNFLSQNILGVPLWIWLLIIAGIIIGVVIGLIKTRKKSQSEMSSSTQEKKESMETSKEKESNIEDIEKQLEKLKDMKEKGLISDEDYEKMKNKILEEGMK